MRFHWRKFYLPSSGRAILFVTGTIGYGARAPLRSQATVFVLLHSDSQVADAAVRCADAERDGYPIKSLEERLLSVYLGLLSVLHLS